MSEGPVKSVKWTQADLNAVTDKLQDIHTTAVCCEICGQITKLQMVFRPRVKHEHK